MAVAPAAGGADGEDHRQAQGNREVEVELRADVGIMVARAGPAPRSPCRRRRPPGGRSSGRRPGCRPRRSGPAAGSPRRSAWRSGARRSRRSRSRGSFPSRGSASRADHRRNCCGTRRSRMRQAGSTAALGNASGMGVDPHRAVGERQRHAVVDAAVELGEGVALRVVDDRRARARRCPFRDRRRRATCACWCIWRRLRASRCSSGWRCSARSGACRGRYRPRPMPNRSSWRGGS